MSEYTEQIVQAVARRSGGWALQVAGSCTPVFVTEREVSCPPAAGDLLRTYPDQRREVVRGQGRRL